MRVPARLEIALSITAYIAGIVGVGLGARLILEAVGPHPAVAQAVYWTIVPAAGLGGLIAFWFLSSRVEFLWRGYQVGFRQGRAVPTRSAMLQASGAGSRSSGFL